MCHGARENQPLMGAPKPASELVGLDDLFMYHRKNFFKSPLRDFMLFIPVGAFGWFRIDGICVPLIHKAAVSKPASLTTFRRLEFRHEFSGMLNT